MLLLNITSNRTITSDPNEFFISNLETEIDQLSHH